MTREEAARVLKYLWIERDENAKLMQQLTKSFFERQEALRIGAAALRGPQPDPATGLMPCAWCGPEWIGRFSVQLWLRAGTWKHKWMSVTQQYKSRVKFCPMCGRKLEVEG